MANASTRRLLAAALAAPALALAAPTVALADGALESNMDYAGPGGTAAQDTVTAADEAGNAIWGEQTGAAGPGGVYSDSAVAAVSGQD
ncbi:hypothetical protein IQ251_19405 [Saccharopolyspora sp. HNM0983]|uniref:Uncharacterized protein n=1 Tax=Saccharopolyspora montiporae TaxID=2781240 RepID=A0A929BB44_9PSEU|nr:hypothetical protein [Saccharopolyspora sp. HNM0983]MBE9376622.1 hypothetical protein [Saccharopolyspora sp. HNM0983]